MSDNEIKIFVLGTRGFPDVPGGVEKHCEQLYPRLVKLGCDVTVITRSPYIPRERRQAEWRGVKFIHLWALKNQYLEAIIHTFCGLLISAFHRPQILHFHAIGPSVLAPLARVLGMKVIVTNHGPDYLRQKWGKFSRSMLILGESMAVKFSDQLIVISVGIKEMLENKYDRDDLCLIPNGVTLPENIVPGETLDRLGLNPGRYVLAASRFVPEKGLLDLIAAYQKLPDPAFKLVLAGGADHENECSRAIKEAAGRDPRIILPGFLSGRPLGELFSNAGLFVLPSYHEGLPIALLEAMSYQLPVLVSDIPPNREVLLPQSRYFPVGDINLLASGIEQLFKRGISEEEKKEQRRLLKRSYNWDRIAEETRDVYRSVL